MPKYRKKPVMIDAIQIPFFERDAEFLWAGYEAPFTNPNIIFKRENGKIVEAIISTLEGTMMASMGDWIIKGVAGELYPCKPFIFDATYERAPKPTVLKESLGAE
jgi:hypothetical protein